MSNDETDSVRNFVVFVDTNAIWTKEDSIELLPASFRATWKEIARAGDVQLKLPDVVLRELAYRRERHFLKLCRDAHAGMATVKSALGIDLPDIPTVTALTIRTAVLAKLRAQIKQTPFCEEISVPYEAVSGKLREIIAASLWRTPPFKESGEGGFRDAMILETVRHAHSLEPHSDFAFITADNRLIQATHAAFDQVSNFGQFSSLDDYAKYLALARVRFAPAFLHAITDKAGAIFEQKVWPQLGLADKIKEIYDLKIGSQKWEPAARVQPGLLFSMSGQARECTGEPEFNFLMAELVGVVGQNEFHWSTKVLVTTPYGKKPEGILARAIYPDHASVRVLLVVIEWRALVTQDQEFAKFGFIRQQSQADVFVDPDNDAVKGTLQS